MVLFAHASMRPGNRHGSMTVFGIKLSHKPTARMLTMYALQDTYPLYILLCKGLQPCRRFIENPFYITQQ
jgi:hypothetical protein